MTTIKTKECNNPKLLQSQMYEGVSRVERMCGIVWEGVPVYSIIEDRWEIASICCCDIEVLVECRDVVSCGVQSKSLINQDTSLQKHSRYWSGKRTVFECLSSQLTFACATDSLLCPLNYKKKDLRPAEESTECVRHSRHPVCSPYAQSNAKAVLTSLLHADIATAGLRIKLGWRDNNIVQVPAFIRFEEGILLISLNKFPFGEGRIKR